MTPGKQEYPPANDGCLNALLWIAIIAIFILVCYLVFPRPL